METSTTITDTFTSTYRPTLSSSNPRGQKLLGRVNKLGVSHVGYPVHGCFNASILKPAHFTMETWREAGPRIGAELEFEVCQLDADTVGVLLIRGRMGRKQVQKLMAAGESSDPNDPAEQLEEPDTEPALEPDLEPSHRETQEEEKGQTQRKRLQYRHPASREALCLEQQRTVALTATWRRRKGRKRMTERGGEGGEVEVSRGGAGEQP
ncbi:unnamed protein product [Coregonus sp. 'balchen']|nr:unnamed protein product [Coregonus sp. 'balchen']